MGRVALARPVEEEAGTPHVGVRCHSLQDQGGGGETKRYA